MIYKIVFIVLAVYLAGGLFLFFYQDKLIFQPDLLHPDYEYKFKFPFNEINFDCPSGNKLNALYFTAQKERKGIIYYHHGNSQDLSLWGYEAEQLTLLGYDVLMYDYAGYGKSTGELTTDKIFSDSKFLLEWLHENHPNIPITLYGRSLGTGVASQLASENHNVVRLIVETPYYSMARMAQTFVAIYPMGIILRIKIRSYQYFPKITCPIFLFHGDRDELIPVRQAKRLVKKNKNAELTIIKGGTHNDLPFHKQFKEKLAEILN